eukprot:scaffold4102_cov404-Prasinococcus_capsulatus_cf.AAC.6
MRRRRARAPAVGSRPCVSRRALRRQFEAAPPSGWPVSWRRASGVAAAGRRRKHSLPAIGGGRNKV